MKSAFVFPLRLFAFWLLFFALFRGWFVIWFHEEWSDETPMSAWASFWHALPLDLSMAGYLAALPIVMWFMGLLAGLRFQPYFQSFIVAFNTLIFSILVFVFGANVFIYEEWHTLLNNRALEYFKTPAALLDSMSLPFKLACVLLYGGAVWLMLKCHRLVVGRQYFEDQPTRWGIVLLPVWMGLLLLSIRGGVGVMPINESAVYYSPHIFDNHAATNTAWHLIHSMVETRSTKNHYLFMADTETAAPFEQLMRKDTGQGNGQLPPFFSQPDSTPLNLFFLIMESHTAQVLESLGGEKGVSPTLESLAKQGILFSNCYGSGYRTDQGIVSVLAGYPAQPDQSIVLLEDKATKLNAVSKTLKSAEYATAFFYGGELTFANLGSWLTNQRFDKIFSEKNFPAADKTQRWGVDDQILLQRSIQEVNQLKQPFFATAMTLSLHPPYDVPYTSQWQGNTDREKFLNSAAFADQAIARFFQSAEQQPWYDHTLFVLVADHGASLPSGATMDRPQSRHIPWIIFGKPLTAEWQGKKMAGFCNHHDIPATILPMIIPPEKIANFPWSRNQWATYSPGSTTDDQAQKGFAYFTNENGIGWATGQGKGFYYFDDKTWKFWEGQLDSSTQTAAKAYLQVLYEDFLQK